MLVGVQRESAEIEVVSGEPNPSILPRITNATRKRLCTSVPLLFLMCQHYSRYTAVLALQQVENRKHKPQA